MPRARASRQVATGPPKPRLPGALPHQQKTQNRQIVVPSAMCLFQSCIRCPFAGHTRAALAHLPEYLSLSLHEITVWIFPYTRAVSSHSPCQSRLSSLGRFSRDACLVAGILFRPQPAANGHDWPLLRRLGSVNSAANPTVTSLQRYPGL